jgi:F-type H+-transporting ATPase subunit b
VSLEWGKIVKSINWTLVFNLVNFAILLYVLKRLLFKPAIAYLDRRREQIAARISHAQEREERAEALVVEREQTLVGARQRAEQIIEGARLESESLVGQGRRQAKEQAERIVAEARLQIEQERDRMIHNLKEAYAEIAVLGAARVLDREVRIEDHRRLLDQLLAEIDDQALRVGT